MLKQTVSIAALVLALLFSAVAIVPCVRLASAQIGSVTIRADGSVSPSTAPIQRLGSLYLVTGDIGQISVERSNMTLDGRGHTIQGEPKQASQVDNIGGISIDNVQNVTVKGFLIKDCAFGFALDYCSNIVISDNNITGTYYTLLPDMLHAGVFIWHGDHINMTGNRLESNEYGIYLGEQSSHNLIVGNTISGSTNEGIRLYESSSNMFYHNNFRNSVNVFDSGAAHQALGSINNWDNGKEGNFWSNYNGTDANRDGVGDTAYWVDTHNKDRYPLMAAWNASRLVDTEPPSVSMISPQDIAYSNGTIPLQFTTDKPASQLSYSVDSQQNVTITGNTTLSDLPNGYHNLTVYVTDLSGNMGVSENINFTIAIEETESFPTLPVAVVSATVVTIACGAVIFYYRKRKTVRSHI